VYVCDYFAHEKYPSNNKNIIEKFAKNESGTGVRCSLPSWMEHPHTHTDKSIGKSVDNLRKHCARRLGRYRYRYLRKGET